MAKILVCDDDREIVEAIDIYLTQEGHEVLKAYDGEEALKVLKDQEVDFLVIDVMMPRLDGLGVLRKMRSGKDQTPVLLLTARGSIEDRVTGLDAGANDYLVKPFALEELLARVRVLLRSTGETRGDCYEVGDLKMCLSTHRVTRGEKEIQLSGKEFALLRYLMQNADIVLSRERLEEHLWNYDYVGSSNVIDAYIRYLRKKIDDGQEEKLIHTVRGAGYVLKVKE